MPRQAKPSISWREKAVALVGALTLAYTAWGFGGVIAWSLHIMLVGGLLTFTLALVPVGGQGAGNRERGVSNEKQGKPPTTQRLNDSSSPIPHLFRTPAFYCVAGFLLYLAIGALNPAWEVASDERGWWLAPVEKKLAVFLPGSVASTYEPMNAWRIFNMHLAAFSLALGLRIGLKHRRMVLAVLWGLLLSGAGMALVAIAQHLNGTKKVLWTLASENPQFWGSFFYRNQGAAFLYWIIVIAGVLYFFHLRQSRERARSGGPHLLAFALVGLILISNSFAISRAGILISAALVAVFVGLVVLDFCIHFIRARHSWKATLLVGLLTATLAVIGGYFVLQSIDWERVEDRFAQSSEIKKELKGGDRVKLRVATLEMAQDQLWTGWGAGSFRYVFPMYQQNYPELFYSDWLIYKGQKGRDFYRYAHTDLVQFIAEYGIVGSALLALAILSLLLPALRLRTVYMGLFLLLGVACIATHAFLDFIFHSPSVWVALIGSLGAVGRLVQLDERHGTV